jgi:uncharacterized protein YigE (DUF2233 family)
VGQPLNLDSAVAPTHTPPTAEYKLYLHAFLLLQMLLLLSPWLSTQSLANPTNTIQFEKARFLVYEVSPNDRLQLFWKMADGTLYNTISAVKMAVEKQEDELKFATNGGMYHLNRNPVGLYIESGVTLSPLTLNDGWGNFFLKPNSVFAVRKNGPVVVDSIDFNAVKDVIHATQSGPLLLKDGKIHPAFNKNSANIFLRSGVGISKQGKAIFAISLDKVNFHKFARLFKEKLDIDNALYLDGDISQIYLPGSPPVEKESQFGPIIAVIGEKP